MFRPAFHVHRACGDALTVKGSTYGLASVVRERDDLISQVAVLEDQLKLVQTELDRTKKVRGTHYEHRTRGHNVVLRWYRVLVQTLDDLNSEQARALENQKKLNAAKAGRESEIVAKIKAAQAAGMLSSQA